MGSLLESASNLGLQVRRVTQSSELASPAWSSGYPTLDGQATKGTRWMPWHQEAMKGVVSCEKLRGAASRRRSGDSRMGQPNQGYAWLSLR